MPQVKIDIYDEAGAYQGSLDINDHTDFPLAITQSISDMRDITKRSGASSKSFKISATANNNRVLKYIYNANVDATDILTRKRARITVDGLPAMEATLKVNHALQQTQPLEYELELVGDNLDWVNALKEIKIDELDYGRPAFQNYVDTYGRNNSRPQAPVLQTLDLTDIEASWRNSYSTGFDYVYALKHYGDSAYRSFVAVTDMRPDIYLHAVIDKAFKKIGYKFESEFFSSDFGNRLIIPYGSKEKFLNKEGLKTNFAVNPSQTEYRATQYTIWNSVHPTPENYIINLNNFSSNGSYVTYANHGPVSSASAKGVLRLHMVFNNIDVQLSEWALYQNGIRVTGMWGTVSGPDPNHTYTLDTTSNISWYAGQEFILKGSMQAEIGKGFNVAGTSLTFTPNDEMIEGALYNIADTLPDVNCLDVLSGTINMFNLYFRTDVVNKTVYCEPRKSFYKGVAESFDWSAKLDVGKEIITEFIDSYNRNVQFKFADDSKDSLVKKWNTGNESVAGSLQYDLPLRFPVGNQDINTKVYAFTFLRRFSGTPISFSLNLPTFWSGDGEFPGVSYDFKPRLLYYAGLVDRTHTVGHPVQQWYWREASHRAKIFPWANLGTDTLQLNYGGANGLVANFYEEDLAIIKEGKIITAYFNLGPTDILKLDLSRPIFINHHNLYGYYYINQVIDYQPNKSDSTKVELIKMLSSATEGLNVVYDNEVDYSEARLGLGVGQGTGRLQDQDLDATLFTPSAVLQNNTGNWAVQNSGSVAMGQGLIAVAANQHLVGRYNALSETDVFQVGAGTSDTDRIRGLTLTAEGNFLVQGGYMYTSDGQEVLFASQRNITGQATRFDKLHLQGNQ